jgi:lipopolysaccharide/colanic/teichoic acid biosynthesis glycosyltransferase
MKLVDSVTARVSESGSIRVLRRHMKLTFKSISDQGLIYLRRRRTNQCCSLSCRSSLARELDAEATTTRPSPWCASVWKRWFDLLCIIPGIILISPVLGMIAIAVRMTSPGPVIFRQQRVGRNRKLFTIYKFRTMVENSEAIGPAHTAKGDPRITFVGSVLRRFKLDEFPQLYNVLRGDMSLVGPRPKLPDHDPAPMACRPGVTGAATLAFRHESRILSEVPAGRIEGFYQEYISPHKLKLDSEYMHRATILSDIGVLFATVLRTGEPITHDELVRDKTVTLAVRDRARWTANEKMIGTAVGKNS